MKTMEFHAGPTIEEALQEARDAARNAKQPVLADINDIVMLIDQDTDINKAVAEYRQKLNMKYEIEKIRLERRR